MKKYIYYLFVCKSLSYTYIIYTKEKLALAYVTVLKISQGNLGSYIIIPMNIID